MEIEAYSYTNKGSRNNNEDYCDYYFENDIGVFVLADGLGGHECGEVASKTATDFVINSARGVADFSDENLLTIMNDANKEILKEQSKDIHKKEMRTTIVCGFIKDSKFKYFNVGDSRIYYFKNGCAYMQSKDHSVSQVAVSMGDISVAEIRFHDDRNKLLKVLGNEEDLKINKIEPFLTIETGDAFMLCSDGFWEYVYETEMEIDLVKAASPKQWCEFMTKRLLHLVSNNNDNFTVICVFVN